MPIQRDSVHFRILARLCGVPRAVRGTSGAMLNRDYDAPWAVDELAAAGLIRERGWHNGPGAVWIPTPAGEEVYRRLVAERSKPAAPRWVRNPAP